MIILILFFILCIVFFLCSSYHSNNKIETIICSLFAGMFLLATFLIIDDMIMSHKLNKNIFSNTQKVLVE